MEKVSMADVQATGFLDMIFNTDRYMPHGYCFLWEPRLLWMFIIGDLATFIAYFSIPITLLYLMRKKKKQIPFRWVFFMFAVFILLCGTTHLLELITLWRPYYYLEAILKILTAAASVATAVMMFPLIPVLIEKFSELEEKNKDNGKKSKK